MAVQDRNSRAVAVLEEVWGQLRSINRRIPAAVVLILSAGDRRGKQGHFSESSWHYSKQRGAHEVAISPALFGYPEKVLATLLHEAAHALLHKQGGGVSGRYGYYHLATFRDTCHKLGLECEFHNTRYGWIHTYWPGSGPSRKYSAVLKSLRALPPGTSDYVVERKGRTLPKNGWVRLACGCEGRAVHVARSVAATGGIECTVCKRPFVRPV